MLRTISTVPSLHAARYGALALVAALWLGSPAPARAGGDFEDGFQDQLGRILAFEAVQAGKALLFYGAAPVVVAPPVYYQPPVAYAVPVPVAAPYPVPYPVPAYGVVHHPHRSVKVVHHHSHHRHKHRGHGRHDGHDRHRYAHR